MKLALPSISLEGVRGGSLVLAVIRERSVISPVPPPLFVLGRVWKKFSVEVEGDGLCCCLILSILLSCSLGVDAKRLTAGTLGLF